MNHWLVKTEPDEYSWDDLVEEGKAMWDGIRNYAARKHLNGMQEGDLVLVYHSRTNPGVVGIAKVVREAYPDPTTEDDRWVAVELTAVEPLPPLSLKIIKNTPALAEIPLVRISRLSVQPVPEDAFALMVKLAKQQT
jgi:predicted RNA-binding protein with PUA-like domain